MENESPNYKLHRSVNLTFERFFLKMNSGKYIKDSTRQSDRFSAAYLGTRVWTGEEWKDLVRQKHIGRS